MYNIYMKTFYIVRHGQTDQNKFTLIQGRGNFPLNETGISQAKEAAKLLSGINFDYAYSSPLDRAYDTARIILDENNINIEVTRIDDLIERDFGEAEGKLVNGEIFTRVVEGRCKNAETNECLERRVHEAFLNLLNRDDGKNILIVAHAHTIKALLISLDYPNYNYYSPLSNTSVSIISADGNKIKICEVNKK